MANQHLDTPWTQDRVEELRRLWAAGYSATEIANELGGHFNRCAVMGKVHRLGLARHKRSEFKPGPPGRSRGQAPRPRKPMLRRAVFTRSQSSASIAPPPKPPPPEPAPPTAPKSFKVPLLKLGEHQCKWPTHSDPYLFCGWRRVDGRPYCAFHLGAAFVKPRGPR